MLLSYEKIFSLEVQPAVRSRAKQLKRLLYVLLFGWVPTVWKMKYTLSGMTFLWCNILRNIWQIPHSHYMQSLNFIFHFARTRNFCFENFGWHATLGTMQNCWMSYILKAGSSIHSSVYEIFISSLKWSSRRGYYLLASLTATFSLMKVSKEKMNTL